MKQSLTILFLFCIFLLSCKRCKDPDAFLEAASNQAPVTAEDSVSKISIDSTTNVSVRVVPLNDLPSDDFINIKEYSTNFEYDLKYATEDNFLKAIVYDCAECYTRVKTAMALIKANAEFMSKGYRIKFFDCYRPHDVQKKMWEIVSNPQYVADPAKGSIHNKGGAVDITLVDTDGNELDMGTTFDYFGREAHHDYFELSETILVNRKLLKETMEKHGFWSIRTEWWHYNFGPASNDEVANFKWKCD